MKAALTMVQMPFLNFESSEMFESTKMIMNNPTEDDSNDLQDDLNGKIGPLLRGYIGSNDLHPRRTLDQFCYYMLGNAMIDRRYKDQVVYR